MTAQKSLGASLKLPVELTYLQSKQDSRGREYFLASLHNDIIKWLEHENIKYKYSDIFVTLWFEDEEDKVRFILKWV